MSPLMIKGLVAAGGIGIGGVSIWQMSEQMRPKTLQQKLEKEGLIFLSFTDDSKLSEWSTKAQNHRDNTENNGSLIKFANLTTTGSGSTTNEDGKALRGKCREVAEMGLGKEDEDNNLQRLRNWCMVSPATTGGSGAGG